MIYRYTCPASLFPRWRGRQREVRGIGEWVTGDPREKWTGIDGCASQLPPRAPGLPSAMIGCASSRFGLCASPREPDWSADYASRRVIYPACRDHV